MEEFHYGPEGQEFLPPDFVYGSYGYGRPEAVPAKHRKPQVEEFDYSYELFPGYPYEPQDEVVIPSNIAREYYHAGDSCLYGYVHRKPADLRPGESQKPPPPGFEVHLDLSQYRGNYRMEERWGS